MKPVSVGDYRLAAQRRLPKFLFEYIDGGSYDEVTAARNISDLQAVKLRQRVLIDVDDVDLSVRLLGGAWSLPVGLGPVGLAGMNARRGERQAAMAAENANVPFCLSTVSACSLEEVRSAVSKSFWFQLYMIRDRALLEALLARAQASGSDVLVLTVDMPVPGTRYRDYRSGLAGAPGFAGQLRRLAQGAARPHWAIDVGLLGRPHSLGNIAPALGDRSGLEDFFAWMRGNFDARVTWDDLTWVRARWAGRIIIKGILDPVDALRAKHEGFDGIVVSNHGGRQLDGVASPTETLPAIRAKVGKDFPVLADGGVRSGLDVVRLLALGADGVLLGRAWAYALAAAGQSGVAHVLDLIAAEMKVAMSLTGVRTVSEIGPGILQTNLGPG